MSRAATVLLSVGVLLFIGVIASQGVSAIAATLALGGWGLLLVALFHLLPLILDAIAIYVLFPDGLRKAGPRKAAPGALRGALLSRWAGESANSLMPGGQIGGPVLMARHLALRGMRMEDAAAAITVSTTLQTFAQIAFALFGVALLGAQSGRNSQQALGTASLVASGVLAVQVVGFYLLQRRGLFSKLTRAASRFSKKRDWSQLVTQAESIDRAVQITYRRPGPVAMSLVLSLIGWFVGTGEVFLILQLFGHPVTWNNALLLESLGQAIRGAAFAIPGALGVQEGGYLLLAPLAGLPPDIALALSLAKRGRELLLGLPGLLYLHLSERMVAPARPTPP